MRKVNLTRDKSFVGCIGTLRVLVEDGAAGDININGTPCRLVAYVKNGETVSFEIGNEATKIYVIADKMSKNYCNDYYPVPEGDADLEIGGKCTYNPGLGNPFRFHGITDEEILKSRKRSNVKGVFILVLCIIIGVVIGLLLNFDVFMNIEKPQTFNCTDFDITLSTAFEAQAKDGKYYFLSDECSLVVFEYDYDEYANLKGMNDAELLDLFKESGFIASDAELAVVEGFSVVEYVTESDSGNLGKYFTVFMRDEEGVFIFEFGSFPEHYEKYRPMFVEWTKSIKLK
ncbi:MAG: hypothetical protein ACI3XI_05490 [Eubacteriales bacterium]